ncbi:DUF4386 domain-containing protein [Maribacter dokdonensis]|uniref:DUF4386 domain-containing protein n=1 Tax=Maribacter dokdonensis TaxID=320912 RepID=UPI00327C6C25
MKNLITNLSASRAAMTVGVAFITSILLVTLIDDFILANFIVPGDTVALAKDIDAEGRLLGFAIVGYLIVLVLDAIIGLALYVVLKKANKNLALLTSILRVMYAFTLMIGLSALAFRIIDVYDYASVKLLGYVFFAFHIFVLGYSVFKSEYMPKTLGILLVIASFTYIVFFVDFHLTQTLGLIIMSTMAIAELSLSIWLMVKRNRLPEH